MRDGTFKRVLAALTKYLRERGALCLSECFIDGTFVAAKKGEGPWGRPSEAKEPNS